MEVQELLDEIIAFRDERDWAQFHTPQQLATAVSIETAELQEEFLWMSPQEAQTSLEDPEVHKRIRQEVADILIYAFLLCDQLQVDPAGLVTEKLTENADKYPVEKARGTATKYTDLSDQ